MEFTTNAELIAQSAMGKVNPELVEKYALLIKFLSTHPETASIKHSKSFPPIGSKDYIERQAKNFSAARAPRAPSAPTTVPDEMVSLILHEYFSIEEEQLERAKLEHSLSMGAENLIGDLLERYLASILEPRGWLWCSGSVIRAVDFIKPPEKLGDPWKLLQVKNRDNSENSSSSAIRQNTTIEKWHRTFSKRPGANWAAFPEVELRQHLSEAAFTTYVKNYLQTLLSKQ